MDTKLKANSFEIEDTVPKQVFISSMKLSWINKKKRLKEKWICDHGPPKARQNHNYLDKREVVSMWRGAKRGHKLNVRKWRKKYFSRVPGIDSTFSGLGNAEFGSQIKSVQCS